MKKLLISLGRSFDRVIHLVGGHNNTNLLLLPDGYVYIRYERLWYISCTPWTGGTDMYSCFMGYTSDGVLYAEFPGGVGLTFERIPDLQVELLRTFS
jgi:hypothetical protein